MPRVMDRARDHTDALRTLLAGLVPTGAAPALVDGSLLLVDGALVAAQRERDRDPADRARAVVADLLARRRRRA
jgi:hypothetical protein